jgi:hypothetical protein
MARAHFKKKLERVKGIEPSYSAWKAAALPLSYTRFSAISYQKSGSKKSDSDQRIMMVGEVGLEPTKP